MAIVINDRVKESSTTTGTGTFDLDGVVSGFEGLLQALEMETQPTIQFLIKEQLNGKLVVEQ